MTTEENPYGFLPTDISWREFEVFCTDTLEAYAQKENLLNYKMKHDEKIEAYDGTYQIDIHIEYVAFGTKNEIIVECKNDSKSIERKVVAELDGKIKSIGANKGILISTSGFQSGARKYAQEHGISLWQLWGNEVRHIVASSSSDFKERMRLQFAAEQCLPKYFISEIDFDFGYPANTIYPTEEMYRAAMEKVQKH